MCEISVARASFSRRIIQTTCTVCMTVCYKQMRDYCLTLGVLRLKRPRAFLSLSLRLALLFITRGAAKELPLRFQEPLVNSPTAASESPLWPLSLRCGRLLRGW